MHHPSGWRRLGAVLCTASLVAAGFATTVGAAGAADSTDARRGAPRVAVPDTAALAGALADQELTWRRCDFSRAAFARPETQKILEDDPDTTCATVVVPQDWHHPDDGRTFTLAISRTASPSRGTRAYRGAMLINPGGPGGSGLPWGAAMKMRAPELAAHYDLIGFDPRGVAASDNDLYCEPDDLFHPKSIAELCAGRPARTLINTEQTTYDLDFVRHLLGQEKISFFGYSYGTWLGGWFAQTFGPHIERMVLDSSLDNTQRSLQHGWDGPQPHAKHRRLEEFVLPWIARHASEIHDRFGLQVPSDPEQVRLALLRGAILLTNSQQVPDPALTPPDLQRYAADLVVAAASVACEISLGAAQSDFGRWAVVCLGDLIDSGSSVDFPVAPATMRPTNPNMIAGRETGVDFLGFLLWSKFATDSRIAAVDSWIPTTTPVTRPGAPGGGAASDSGSYVPFHAIRCSDGQWVQDPAYYDTRYGDMLTTENSAWGTLVRDNQCVGWTTDSAMPTLTKASAKAFPDTLEIQAEFDSRTEFELGARTATLFPNTTGVFVDNESDHGVFPYADSCVDPTVIDFLVRGKRPARNVVCQAHPLPLETAPVQVGGVVKADGSLVYGETPLPGRGRAAALSASERRGQQIIDELRSGIAADVAMAELGTPAEAPALRRQARRLRDGSLDLLDLLARQR